jgi:hypothetical protein
MPLYFLHILDWDNRVADLEGEELPSLSHAIEVAEDSARDILIERLRQHKRADGQHSQIEITDAKGVILALVELSDVAIGKR